MSIEIQNADYELGWLRLKVDARDASKFLSGFKAGQYDLTKHKEKRSNNANSYAWLLMGKIASVMKVSTEEVYLHVIENIGGKTTVVSVASYAKDDFELAFRQGHLGRRIDIIGEHDGMTDLLVTYGSSDYDTSQMSELLDSVIEECKVLGIEYKSKDYIDTLLAEWAEQRKS